MVTDVADDNDGTTRPTTFLRRLRASYDEAMRIDVRPLYQLLYLVSFYIALYNYLYLGDLAEATWCMVFAAVMYLNAKL